MTNIYVIGGNGFLGKTVILYLRKIYSNVINCDLSIKNNSKYSRKVNVCDLESLEKNIKKKSIVINCAGVIGFKKADISKLNKVHVEGTKNVLQCCINKKVTHYIHVSSIACMGFCTHGQIEMNEDNFGNPEQFYNNYYSLSKYKSDILVRKYEKKGHNVSIIYPGILIGQGGSVFLKTISGKIPRISPNGILPIVDVRDCSSSIVNILQNKIYDKFIIVSENVPTTQFLKFIENKKNNNNKNIFSIPSLLHYPLKYLVSGLENFLPISSAQIDQGFRNRRSSSNKAKQKLSWKPKYSLEESINSMVDEIKPVYIVIGGSKGLGKSTIDLLLQENCYIYNISRSENSKVINLLCDINNTELLQKYIKNVFLKHNHIDTIFACTGKGLQKTVAEMSYDEIDSIFNLNFRYLIVIAKQYYSICKSNHKKGKLLIVSSIADRFSMPKYSAYSSSKHAVRSFFSSFSKEQQIIKINMIHPFRIDTEFFNNYSNKPKKWQMLSSDKVARAFISRKDSMIKSYYYDLICIMIRLCQFVIQKQIR